MGIRQITRHSSQRTDNSPKRNNLTTVGMRLINVNTYELTQFLSRETTPAYIIASHTWLKPRRNQSQEPSCEDVEKGIHRQKAGWRKVEELCAYIKRRYPMIEWLWYDPCCIDQRHSQEVQSSIMSMFQWYQNAYCCLAYLKDIASYSDFSQSEWFTRGWTLQELLAPTYVVLLNRDQIPLGYKGPRYRNREELLPTAVPAITTTTWIPEGILYDSDEQKIEHLNPNDILGWMKNRNTSRLEDQAYCLLGLFDLSMNVRYGESEGAKATGRMKSKLDKHRAWQFENPRLRSRDLREKEPSNLPFADEEVKMIIGTAPFTTSTFPYEEQPRAFFQTGKIFAKANGTAVQKFVVVARNDRVDPDQCLPPNRLVGSEGALVQGRCTVRQKFRHSGLFRLQA